MFYNKQEYFQAQHKSDTIYEIQMLAQKTKIAFIFP